MIAVLNELLACPSSARSLICGAALHAASDATELVAQAGGEGFAPGEIFWRHSPRLASRWFKLLEIVSLDGDAADRRAWAERLVARADLPKEADIALLSLFNAKPPLGYDDSWTSTDSGLHYICGRSVSRRETISLPDDYGSFIDGLGAKTRCDVTRYRRKFAASGGRYAFCRTSPHPMDAPRRCALSRVNASWPKSRERIAGIDRFIDARARPFFATLISEGDAIVSCIAGLCRSDAAFVAYQLNDRDRANVSLSTVLRGHLIETLIDDGVRELNFPNGCRGLCRPACRQSDFIELVLVRRRPVVIIKAAALAISARKTKVGDGVRIAKIARPGIGAAPRTLRSPVSADCSATAVQGSGSKIRCSVAPSTAERHSRKATDTIHFLHIGKTGGTAVKSALKPIAARFGIALHPHAVGLADVPEFERVIFTIRDPVDRFISGFNSRLRKGAPLLHVRWDEGEERAFASFQTPDELAFALTDKDPMVRGRARRAMRDVRHVNQPLARWFPSPELVRVRQSDIAWIGRTEALFEDFEALKSLLGLPRDVALPTDDVEMHRTPRELSTELSEIGRRNVESWYARDIRVHRFLLRMRKVVSER